jgi:hypothetical protein
MMFILQGYELQDVIHNQKSKNKRETRSETVVVLCAFVSKYHGTTYGEHTQTFRVDAVT